MPRVLAIDPYQPLAVILAQQATDQGGLAGTIGTHQGNAVAPLDQEIDTIEHRVALKLLADLLKAYH